MLNAFDKSAVLSWTERQLGDTAVRAAVVEVSDRIISEWVEKSGTGLECNGCEALLSVMADSIQHLAGSKNLVFTPQNMFEMHQLKSAKATVH